MAYKRQRVEGPCCLSSEMQQVLGASSAAAAFRTLRMPTPCCMFCHRWWRRKPKTSLAAGDRHPRPPAPGACPEHLFISMSPLQPPALLTTAARQQRQPCALHVRSAPGFPSSMLACLQGHEASLEQASSSSDEGDDGDDEFDGDLDEDDRVAAAAAAAAHTRSGVAVGPPAVGPGP